MTFPSPVLRSLCQLSFISEKPHKQKRKEASADTSLFLYILAIFFTTSMSCFLTRYTASNMPNRFSTKYLLMPTSSLYNQEFVFLFYVSAKCKYTAKYFRIKTVSVNQHPSSCNPFVYDAKHLETIIVH